MNRLRGYILGVLVWVIYRTLSWTWRVRVHEPEELKKYLSEKKHPLIFSHFHGDELVLISLVARYKIATMTSTSKDGEIMDTTLHLLGAKTSRGSSTRGGVTALKGLIALTKKGHNCSFAVDGPKGPIHEVKPGVFEVSRLMKGAIFAAGISCDRAWHFPRSWNKTYLPKPFAKIQVLWLGPALLVDKTLDPRSPDLAKVLQNQLFDARRRAANFIAG